MAAFLLLFLTTISFSQLGLTPNKSPVPKINAPIHTAFVTEMSKETMRFGNPQSATKDEKKLRRRRSILHEFSLNTSTHGLPGIARSESVHNRIFWSISFICFTGVMTYFVTTALIIYFNYPTQIDLNVIREWPQYFPAVSICNAAPFRLDRFIQSFFNYTRSKNITTPTNANMIPAYLGPLVAIYIIERVNSNQPLDPDFYSLSSILYRCTFNNAPCSVADFIPFTSSSYGLCYTFNAKMKNSSAGKLRYGNENGGSGVLELELYAHTYQYVPYLFTGKDRRN